MNIIIIDDFYSNIDIFNDTYYWFQRVIVLFVTFIPFLLKGEIDNYTCFVFACSLTFPNLNLV